MDLQEFSQKFAQIKAQGWVPSQRRGPTGIGHTFEHLLGLTENNIALPDLGKIEIKAHRIGATSLITCNYLPWLMEKPLPLVIASVAHVPSAAWGKQSSGKQGDCFAACGGSQ